MNRHIIRAIHEYLKTHYTLTEITEQAYPILEGICDSADEAEKIMEPLARFYREHWNSKDENETWMTYQGKTYNAHGGKDNVITPENVREEGSRNGLLFSIHNHPSGLSIQSDADINDMGLCNEKYMITVARDGITITKNPSHDWDVRVGMKAINRWTDNLLSIIDETPEMQELDRHMLDYTDDEYMTQYEKIQYKWLNDGDNYNEQMDKLNRTYKDYGLPLETTHIMIRKW